LIIAGVEMWIQRTRLWIFLILSKSSIVYENQPVLQKIVQIYRFWYLESAFIEFTCLYTSYNKRAISTGA
jgi:hypothetical protein